MNAIVSISFHTQKHAHVLNIIDEAKKAHPNMTRSAIIRSMVLDGADSQIMMEILDEYVPSWRGMFAGIKRKQQGLT